MGATVADNTITMGLTELSDGSRGVVLGMMYTPQNMTADQAEDMSTTLAMWARQARIANGEKLETEH